tara:strand:+ start:1758 stop:2429 length:672 start_codon:yes stop_codon:yes gene_type:complete
MKRVLIIAAHPDDETLGCGGIINRFKDSVEFKVAFISEGTSCRFEDCVKCADEISKKMQDRKDSAQRALAGIDISFYDLPCGKLDQVPQLKINRIIEKEIRDFKPDTVFTHWSNDANLDHRKVYDATIIATRPGCSSVKSVLCYEVLSTTEWNFQESFRPNCFYELSAKDVDAKCENMQEYSSECQPWPHPRSASGIKTLCKFRGMQAGFEFAESFEVVRRCI